MVTAAVQLTEGAPHSLNGGILSQNSAGDLWGKSDRSAGANKVGYVGGWVCFSEVVGSWD